VHEIDIKHWALKKAREINDATFAATDFWLSLNSEKDLIVSSFSYFFSKRVFYHIISLPHETNRKLIPIFS
jgi:hypothetical protein